MQPACNRQQQIHPELINTELYSFYGRKRTEPGLLAEFAPPPETDFPGALERSAVAIVIAAITASGALARWH